MRYGKIRIEDGYLAYSRHMMLNSLPCKDIVWAYMRREGDDSPGGSVKQIISNIREQIESFNQAEDRGWQLGTAVGYAFAEEAPDRSYTTLYELADQRMYENKRAMKATRT